MEAGAALLLHLQHIFADERGQPFHPVLVAFLLFRRGRGREAAGAGLRPGRFGRAPAGLFTGDGAKALGKAVAALVGGDGKRFLAGGGEALALRMVEKLLHAERRLADGAAGGAVGPGERQGRDIGALHLRIPAVGAGGAAGDGIEIEKGAEGGERVLSGQALGAAAVAEDGDGGGRVIRHGPHRLGRKGGCRKMENEPPRFVGARPRLAERRATGRGEGRSGDCDGNA